MVLNNSIVLPLRYFVTIDYMLREYDLNISTYNVSCTNHFHRLLLVVPLMNPIVSKINIKI